MPGLLILLGGGSIAAGLLGPAIPGLNELFTKSRAMTPVLIVSGVIAIGFAVKERFFPEDKPIRPSSGAKY